MPTWMSSVIASCLPVLALSRNHRSAILLCLRGDGLLRRDADVDPARQRGD